jgi:acyl-CoA thioester hydrolase
MPLADFRSVTRFRVPFCDIDMMQHVNNAAYVVWAETARCVYFDEVLGGALNGREGIILAKLEITYERPLEYREAVAVASRVTRIGNKSFELLCEMWSDDTSQRSAFCTVTLVAYNYEAKASIPIPQKWREQIAAHELVAPDTGQQVPTSLRSSG